MKKNLAINFTVITIICGLIAGCGDGNTTTLPTTTPTSTAPTTATSTAPTSTPTETFGSMSQRGSQVFSNFCSQCHGPGGGGGSGPAVIGDNANIANNYQNAKELYDFIRTAMPANLPGSLSALQYQQLVSYLMIKNNFVDSQTPFDANNLEQVPIN